MPTRERLDGFVEAVASGRFVEALRDFYHEGAVTKENSGPERRGLATLIAIEEQVLRAFRMRTRPPGRILLDGDEVAIQWTFDITDPQGRDTADGAGPELVRTAARLLGFRRVGPDLQARIASGVELLG